MSQTAPAGQKDQENQKTLPAKEEITIHLSAVQGIPWLIARGVVHDGSTSFRVKGVLRSSKMQEFFTKKKAPPEIRKQLVAEKTAAVEGELRDAMERAVKALQSFFATCRKEGLPLRYEKQRKHWSRQTLQLDDDIPRALRKQLGALRDLSRRRKAARQAAREAEARAKLNNPMPLGDSPKAVEGSPSRRQG